MADDSALFLLKLGPCTTGFLITEEFFLEEMTDWVSSKS